MNVPADVFKWLQSVGIAKEGKKVQDNRIELAPETAESIKVGYLFAEVIRSACRSEPNCNKPIMKTMISSAIFKI